MEIIEMTEKKIYTKNFYAFIGQDALESAKIVIPLILNLISCEKAVDVGCGNGAWLKILKEYGLKKVLGIDGNYVDETTLLIQKEEFMPLDLKESIEIHEKFDLVISLEVAEHLPSDCAEKFVNSLTTLGPVILFSAAIPHQGGENHINEQWPDYWFKFFEDRDYVAIDFIRKKIWNNPSVAYWYKQNTFLFVEKSYLETNDNLKQEFEKDNTSFNSIVHPDMYIHAQNKIFELEKALQNARALEALSAALLIKLLFELFKRSLYKLKTLLNNVKRIKFSLKDLLEQSIRSLVLKCNVKHLYGTEIIDYQKNELVVTCLVRNGEIYINSFIQHYISLGVKHIVFLDNGSTDRTVEIAKSYNNATILQTMCPYGKYETLMKKYLVNRFSKNRWNLFVDIDELFDYPFSDFLSLSSFLDYLNQNSYTAVVSQMLDMFSDRKISELNDRLDDNIKSTYNYYDISEIRFSKYRWSKLENEKIKMHFGGIRKTLFNTDNGLSKAALVFVDRKIGLFIDFHHVRNANLADITGVILHYPFTSQFYDKVVEAVETDRYAMSASHEYKKYLDVIQSNEASTIKQVTSCKLNNISELIDNEFLVVSEKYLQWIHDLRVF